MPSSEIIKSSPAGLTEKCGVFGTFTPGVDSALITLDGIRDLQHRGQDAAGIYSVSESGELTGKRNTGLVDSVFPNDDSVANFRGDLTIGHTRYGTSHAVGRDVMQPVIKNGDVTLAHNGNLPDTGSLEKFMTNHTIPNPGFNDSEMMQAAVEYFVEKGAPIEDAIKEASPLFTGAWSIVMTDKKSHSLIAARDPWGMRPLSFGQNENGFSVGSESRSLKGYENIAEIRPGEMVIFNGHELTKIQYEDPQSRFDIFEILYLMKSDSIIFGQRVEDLRRNLGKQLGKELQNEPLLNLDMIVPTPETAIPYSEGISEMLGLPVTEGLIKKPKSQRTFIASDFSQRAQLVDDKISANPDLVRGRNIGLVDDTVVRGTTTGVVIKKLREAGANEVHLLIPSSPIHYPDFYGVNTPYQEDLIANRFETPEELAHYLNANSIHYLSVDGMIDATEIPREKLSVSAFTGEYPIPLKSRESEVRKVKPLRLHSRQMQLSISRS